MKTQYLIAAIALVATTGGAFAQTAEYVAPDANFVSTKTRTEVNAELVMARAQGLLVQGNVAAPVTATATTRTRADVRAEAVQTAKQGQRAKVNDIYFGS